MNLRHDIINCHIVRAISPRDYEFLQLRRTKGTFMGETWGTVRGGIEPGETAWQAALRELREETSLVPLEIYQLDTLDMFYLAAEDSIRLTPGFCAIVPPDAPITLNEEHDQHRWLSRDAIVQLTLFPGERQQLEELIREILDDGPAKPHLRIQW